jgi:transposase
MPGKRSPMRKITEVLRLKFEAKLSHATIARAVGLSKGAVNKYVSLAQARGLSWPLPEELDEAGLEALLYPPRAASTRYVEPDHARLHTELRRKGVTLQLLWSEYAAAAGAQAYRYSQFCERYRQWVKRQRRSLRQVHRAGEKLFIDYCGPTVPVVDATTGEGRQAQVFVAVLGASNYTYAEATWTQSLPDWIGSHQRALAFFGGVPALLVPDNLRAGVTLRRPLRPRAQRHLSGAGTPLRHGDPAGTPV